MMNKYIYAMFGLYFLLNCLKSHSARNTSDYYQTRIICMGDSVTEEIVFQKSDPTNSTTSQRVELFCNSK